MKKTLCKELHKDNINLFICLEDIIEIKVNKNEIIIEASNILGNIRLNAGTEKDAEEIHQRLIKELEEYYGLDCKK